MKTVGKLKEFGSTMFGYEKNGVDRTLCMELPMVDHNTFMKRQSLTKIKDSSLHA